MMRGLAIALPTALGVIAMATGWKGMPTEDRVKTAFEFAEPTVRKMCTAAGLHYPPKQIFFRAFKSKRQLQVWGSNGPKKRFHLIAVYDIAAMSGELGPKRKEGDLQVPEGVYYIDRFNPFSRFRLSLGLNYPNAADRKFADRDRPGGDIFIHGNQVSIGCMAMTDEKIDQIYILALQAKNAGQQRIPVHVFPFPLTKSNLDRHSGNADLTAFWSDLKPIYDHFEKHRKVPSVKIDSHGRYSVK